MEKLSRLILVLLFVLLYHLPDAQNISITNDGTAPSANAILDVKSTTKGVKIPRLTTSQRNAINTSSSDAGLLVFDTDKGTLYMFDGDKWLPFAFLEYTLPALVKYPGDGSANDNFGFSVAIDGDYAIVGAPYNDINIFTDSGSAYIFHRSGSGWKQQAKLTPSDGGTGDWFGYSVDIDGDYAIVGAYGYDFGTPQNPISAQGAAYIFHRTSGSTWVQEAILTALTGDEEDWFGYSVGISGDFAIVGAPHADVQNPFEGAVYFYRRLGNAWPYQVEKRGTDTDSSDEFGTSVSISGDYALIGAPHDKINPGDINHKGSAYIFYHFGDPNSWTQSTKLTASDGGFSDNFGYSVSINGMSAVIGAPFDDIGPDDDQGSAYYFGMTPIQDWHEIQKLTVFTGNESDNFGKSVSIDAPYIIIGGAKVDIGANEDQGASYLFKFSAPEYGIDRRILEESTGPMYFFGQAVGISNANVLIGSNALNTKGVATGAVTFMNVE